MNPNASWDPHLQQQQQGQNNQQQRMYPQQQQFNPYAPQQAAFNPYGQQQQYPPQYMQQPLPPQQQQQFPPQPQVPFNPQQGYYPPQQQAYYGGQSQAPNAMHPYQQNMPQYQQPTQYQPQQNMYPRHPQQPQVPMQPHQSRQHQVPQQVPQPRYPANDNWEDEADDHPRPTYSNTQKQSQATQKQSSKDDWGSDEDQNDTAQNQQKKKKRRRGGRNKKGKDTKDSTASEKSNQNTKEKTKENKKDSPKPTPKKESVVETVTSNVEALKIEEPPKNEKKNDSETKTKTKAKPTSVSVSASDPTKYNEASTKTKTKTASKEKDQREKPSVSKENASEEKEQVEVNEPKPKSKKKKSKKVKWDAHDPREHLNLVLIGHVDAGKSTISGQILLATNQIDERTIAKYKKEAKEKNRESWWIAYIMDEDDDERNKGKTVECGRAHFDTDLRRYTILDAPGHKNYVPNMISGASQADVAILVISARRGEFEAGFDRGGQTREHALLALTLGISRIIIVVNKMDCCKWREERYKDIESRVTKFLCDDIGFKKKYIDILPISGQTAKNIKTKVTKDVCPWFDGQTLIEKLDSIKKVKRATGDILRIPILDRYKGDKGLQAIGKVEAGIVKVNDTVMVMPTEVTTQIIAIAIDDTPTESAGAGENVLLSFDKGGISMDQIFGGCVICAVEDPTKVVESFVAEIYIHEIPGGGILTSGYGCMFHAHNVSTMCEIESMPHKLHKKTGKRSKAPPKFLRAHDRAIVVIKLDQKCALEAYDDCAALGRFTMRDRGKTVVIGKIREIIASASRLRGK